MEDKVIFDDVSQTLLIKALPYGLKMFFKTLATQQTKEGDCKQKTTRFRFLFILYAVYKQQDFVIEVHIAMKYLLFGTRLMLRRKIMIL